MKTKYNDYKINRIDDNHKKKLNKDADSEDNKENTHELCNNILLHIFECEYVEYINKITLLSKRIHRLIPLFGIQILAAHVW